MDSVCGGERAVTGEREWTIPAGSFLLGDNLAHNNVFSTRWDEGSGEQFSSFLGEQ